MEKINNLKKLFATVAIAAVTITASYGQADLGAACGCPPVASRPKVLVSTLAISGGIHDGELRDSSAHWDCTKRWILDKKIYVPKGAVLTVDPGTVIMGRARLTADSATMLLVEKGAKMIAVGSSDCQVVMTAENDPMDGTYAVKNDKMWGGLLIAGYAVNNLSLAKNGPFQPGTGDGKICVENGVGTFEGMATSDQRVQFGAKQSIGEKPNDHDNSGIYRYLSVRYSGAILQVGGEINGISCGSVGDGTTMDHIEVISSADDNMEFWGGTVNVKYATFMFGNDDMYDTDDGYRGKLQFIFAVSPSTNDTILVSPDHDNGFEVDADDQRSGNFPRSHQIAYNCTFISNNKHVLSSDNTGIAAIMAKELTEGEWYNCIFANFPVGLNLWTGGSKLGVPVTQMPSADLHASEGTRSLTQEGTWGAGSHQVLDVYDNWMYGDLKVQNNTFINCIAPLALDCGKQTNGKTALQDSYIGNPAWHTPSSDDLTKFATDGNVSVASIPGFVYNWSMNGNTNAVTTPFNPIPSSLSTGVSSTITAPADGFFTPVSYRGAFEPGKKAWVSPWAYSMLVHYMSGVVACPTDINVDGKTDNSDFLQLLGNFNNNCQ